MSSAGGSSRGQHHRKHWGKRFNKKQHPRSDNPGHPSHLKGREIGRFYAERQKRLKLLRPLGTILLSESNRRQIHSLLASFAEGINTQCKEGSYDHIADSKFKSNFLNIVTGNILEKLVNYKDSIKQDVNLDERLCVELQTKAQNTAYARLHEIRRKLPSYDKRNEIIDLVEKNQVTLISGETGCGKTTQVAQFILDSFITAGKGSLCRIVCTQPRRISAIAVASRVAEERAEPLGISAGYHIRLEKKFPRDRGSVCFCTTGVLLKQMETDPCLSEYSHVVLDEIHERDVISDFLLTLIKDVIKHRKDLKVILMSATLNSEQFAKYYGECAQINIPGFTYPVQEFYLEDVIERTGFAFEQPIQNTAEPHYKKYMKKGKEAARRDKEFSDFIEPHVRQLENDRKYSRNTCIQLRSPESENANLDLIHALLVDICEKEQDKGAILVFLTGYVEISNLFKAMEKSGKFPSSRYRIFPLHSQMPTVDQRQIFERPPAGIRKIILSTNIAETSITIDDVVFVIDCGKIKISNFNAETNTKSLVPEWVSLANASQRKGRAGRVQPGVCYHLYSRAREMTLEQYQKPEILRSRLEDIILTAKILQLGKVEEFFSKLMDPPDPQSVKISLDLLRRLNALDSDENLTPLGYHLAKLPIAPQMGKMILFGAMFSCLNPILCIAATLDFKDAFQLPLGKEDLANRMKLKLAKNPTSDHLLYFEALNTYESISPMSRRQFCWEYFLSSQTLNLLIDMKKQFMQYLHEMNFVPNMDPHCEECNMNSDNESLVKAIICAGLYPNILIGNPKKKRNVVHTLEGVRAELHPKSILCRAPGFDSSLLAYYIKIKSSGIFIHDATVVQPLPIVFFGDNYNYAEVDGGDKMLIIGNRLRFKCSEATAETIKELKDRLNWFLEYKISHPGEVDWKSDSPEINVLRAIMELITIEDIGDFDLDAYDDFD